MNKELLELATSFSRAGFVVFKAIGKKPAEGLSWPDHPYTLPSDMEDYLKDWKGNYAVVPKRDQLIIDIDPRSFAKGDRPHSRFFAEADLILAAGTTTIVQTGGKEPGLHVYFRLPELPEGKKIKKNLKAYKGIDFLSNGSYAIGAGSINIQTKNVYQLLKGTRDPSEMAELPQKLLELLLVDEVESLDRGVESTTDEDPIIALKYKEILTLAPAAVEGDGGDATTYMAACKGRDLGLSVHKTFDLMAEHYNPRCAPEWPLEELLKKVKNAYSYANGTFGSDTPQSDFKEVPKVVKHLDWRGWDRKDGGPLHKTVNNVINFFINSHENPDNPLLDSLIYNEFSLEITKIKWFPWDKPNGRKMPKAGIEWTENDTIQLKAYLSVKKSFDVARKTVEDCLIPIACKKSFHPVRDYLRNLKWDGVPRLGTWLTHNSGLSDSKLDRELSKIMIMQAVARIFQPGCQCDLVMVLEGKQGIYKTTLVRLLGGEFYADIPLDTRNKDTPDAMRGKWILEMSEMSSHRKAVVEELKRFLTTTFDRYRAPFARKPKDIQRQSVFIGTINPDATGEYLNDPTGNRRYGPMNLGDTKIDIKAIKKIRDQVFAEATDKYLQGEKIYITDAELLQQLEERQQGRQTADPFIDDISDYILKNKPHVVKIATIWQFCLGGNKDKLDIVYRKRIANCLRDLGYINKTARISGKPRSCYVNEEYKYNEAKEGLLD